MGRKPATHVLNLVLTESLVLNSASGIEMKNRGNSSSSPSMIEGPMSEYVDLLPVMAEKLDEESFMSELCGGFQVLAEPERGLITPESLRKNSLLLGMEEMGKEESEAMVKEGDLDGDGGLNEMEFCILMVRLSPGMMQDAEAWLEKALHWELRRSV